MAMSLLLSRIVALLSCSTLLLLCNTSVFGQLDKISFDHLGTADGLPNPVVTSIIRDYQGFMWFGTYNGLARYDGHEFKYYVRDLKDSSALQDSRITTLFEDREKTLWIGTHRGGLYRYDPVNDNFKRYHPGSKKGEQLTDNHVTSIYQDNRGNLWIGTFNGLNLYEKSTGRIFDYKIQVTKTARIRSTIIVAVTEDADGNVLFLINDREIYTYNRDRNTIEKSDFHTGLLNGNEARLLYMDGDATLWIATKYAGLITYSKGIPKRIDTGNPVEPSQPEVSVIYMDHHHRVWTGTSTGEIRIYEAGKVTSVIKDHGPGIARGLSSNVIITLYCDSFGTIWIGTTEGVDQYHSSKPIFEYYTSDGRPGSLSNKMVLSVLEDRAGRIWVGTDGGGLNLFDRSHNTFQDFRHRSDMRNSISCNRVKSLYEDRAGNLWIGTMTGGLNLMDRKTNTFTQVKSGNAVYDEAMKMIWRIREDHSGNLWLSTIGNGIFVYNPKEKTFEQFKPKVEGGLTDYNVFEVFEDSKNRMWVGTENQGINLYDFSTKKFTYIKTNPADSSSLSDDHPWTILEDSHKDIWVATADGLNRLNTGDKTSFTRYYKKDGLGNSITLGIMEDPKGNLWIPTGLGISKFTRKTGKIKNYSKSDGLEQDHFHINASAISKAGDLYLGGPNGLQIFNTSYTEDSNQVSPIVITGLNIFNKPVKPGHNGLLEKSILYTHEITLQHDQSFISLTFAYLNYVAPKKNKYAYRLKGLSDKWVHTNQPEASFAGLSQGTYVFEVQGGNGDDSWNPQTAELTIVILPAWWQSWWFRTIVVTFILLSLYSLYRYRISVMEQLMCLKANTQLAQQEAILLDAQLKNEKLNMELTKNKLEMEVRLKNAELASTVMNMAKQNEILLQIKEDISTSSKMVSGDDKAIRQLRQVERLINREINRDGNQDHFESLFNQLHDNFNTKLKERYPELTSRDIRFLAYLRMNLTSKEIAALFNLSPRGIEDLRYRIRKKMQLDSTVNLSEFIISLQID